MMRDHWNMTSSTSFNTSEDLWYITKRKTVMIRFIIKSFREMCYKSINSHISSHVRPDGYGNRESVREEERERWKEIKKEK